MKGLSQHEMTARRLRLQAKTGIGLGNFFWKALDVYPGDWRSLIPARPFETAWGESCADPTLNDWARWATAYARRYAGMGVGRQDPVGVYGDFGAKYLLHFLALSRLGAIAVLVNERMPVARAARHLRRVGVVGVVADEPRRKALRESGVDLGFVAVEADLRSAPAVDPTAYVHDEHDPVLITHSSGTTGFPKAVLSKHGAFFYPMENSLGQPTDPATLRAVCALPPSHNSAIGAVVIAMVNGRELIQTSSQDGKSVVEAIKTYRPSSVVAFPRTYVDILALEPKRDDLSSVEMWINLGDSAHEAHIRPLMRYGHHRQGLASAVGSRFVDGLGSSEMGSMLFSTIHSPGECTGRCVGSTQPGVDAAIFDAEGKKAQAGRPGRLGVRSPGLFGGYWNNSNLTYKSRRNGYFLTGDVAYRDDAGQYHHLDRVTDTVTTDLGPIHTLVYEEAVMNAVDAIADCTVVAIETFPGKAHIVCFAIARKGWAGRRRPLEERIRAAVTAEDLQPLDDVRLVESEALPVGVTGKVLKSELRRALRRELASRSATAGVVSSESRASWPLHAQSEAAR